LSKGMSLEELLAAVAAHVHFGVNAVGFASVERLAVAMF